MVQPTVNWTGSEEEVSMPEVNDYEPELTKEARMAGIEEPAAAKPERGRKSPG
jgi:hypothetical protein